jgi:hypothetical protein
VFLEKVSLFLQSPANWSGLATGTASLALSGLGIATWGGSIGALGLAAIGYGAGFGIGGLWLGFPKLNGNPWDGLEFADEGDARTSMQNALYSVKQLVEYNPNNQLNASLQTKVLELCKKLTTLLEQWDYSKGSLSLEESFHARHIALRYLPDALKTYLSIPKEYATTKVLSNGKTAEDTFKLTLQELCTKVDELTNDLANQDAEAFLNHSKFLNHKFGADKPIS